MSSLFDDPAQARAWMREHFELERVSLGAILREHPAARAGAAEAVRELLAWIEDGAAAVPGGREPDQ